MLASGELEPEIVRCTQNNLELTFDLSGGHVSGPGVLGFEFTGSATGTVDGEQQTIRWSAVSSSTYNLEGTYSGGDDGNFKGTWKLSTVLTITAAGQEQREEWSLSGDWTANNDHGKIAGVLTFTGGGRYSLFTATY